MTGRDHGGDLGEAIRRFGGGAADWLDLSTGINRMPWPAPPISAAILHSLPGAEASAVTAAAARTAFDVAPAARCLPLAGAQAGIGLVPRLRSPGLVRILGPTYNEHAAAFASVGWRVEPVSDRTALRDADVAVVVNPNNPDGSGHAPPFLLDLADRVGLLIVDESFADVAPELSLCPQLGRPGLLVLRSFGKFWGLAGLRLGFVLGAEAEIAALAALAGPWPVSAPALAIGAAALADRAWAESTRTRLREDAVRLDQIAFRVGWSLVGGTALFRTYATGDAATAQQHLARQRIWSRRFPWSPGWLRLGLPGPEPEWRRLDNALADQNVLRRPT